MIEGYFVLLVILGLFLTVPDWNKIINSNLKKVVLNCNTVRAIGFSFLYALTLNDVLKLPKHDKYIDFKQFIDLIEIDVGQLLFYGLLCCVAVLGLSLFVSQMKSGSNSPS